VVKIEKGERLFDILWQFLKLKGSIVTINLTGYPLESIDRLLVMLLWMVQTEEEK
jgi:hypothetical protein